MAAYGNVFGLQGVRGLVSWEFLMTRDLGIIHITKVYYSYSLV
jgi:hypothetical protein